MTNETIDKILNELKRVERLLVNIRETGKVSDIERDIIMAKLRTMYEFIQFIQPETIESVKQKVGPVKETVTSFSESNEVPFVEKIVERKEDVESPVKETPEPVTEPKKEKPPVVAEMPVTVPLEPIKQEVIPGKEIKPESKPEPKPKSEAKPKPEILAEKFESKSFLHETLAQYQNTHDLSRKFQHTPLKDIFSAISLNDRFLFIKELFDNDSVLFQNTIEILNSSGSFNPAVQYLDSQFHWDFNEPMVQKLLDLVHRRYLAYE
jgi:hypothetical protein